MTRIIAGAARGRRLSVPAVGTRPTTDQVRESVFNILTNRIDFSGLVVLDLFAGSGALGLEALSRGAGTAVLVESDPKAAKTIGGNIASSGLTGARLVRRRVTDHLRAGGPVADLVFADPPYDLPDEQIADLLIRLSAGPLAVGGLVVLERSVRSAPTTWPATFDEPEVRTYGETRIEMAELGPIEAD